MTLVVITGGFLVGPGGLFYSSIAWRIGITLAVIALVILGLLSIAVTAKAWRDSSNSRRSLLPLSVAAMTSATILILAAIAWLPFLGRIPRRGSVASQASFAMPGLPCNRHWVVYEVLHPQRAQRVLADPSFKLLSPEVQKIWRGMAGNLGAGTFDVLVMLPRFAEYAQTIAGTLHRHGVHLVAGTDALGLPLVIPGSSLLRELHLLTQSGLTPYEAIRAATVNPASFLRKEHEFGSILVGKRADLLLLDRNPLETISAFNQPVGVMV